MTPPDWSWDPSPHTADLAMKITASSQFYLFQAALSGMLGILEFDTELSPSEQTRNHLFSTTSTEIENLLVDFLTECIYLMEVHSKIPVRIENLALTDDSLRLDFICRAVRDEELPEIGHIKAVTYHDLDVKEIGGKFEAVIVFDT